MRCLWWLSLKKRQCQHWFVKFRSVDFSLRDEKRSVENDQKGIVYQLNDQF